MDRAGGDSVEVGDVGGGTMAPRLLRLKLGVCRFRAGSRSIHHAMSRLRDLSPRRVGARPDFAVA